MTDLLRERAREWFNVEYRKAYGGAIDVNPQYIDCSVWCAAFAEKLLREAATAADERTLSGGAGEAIRRKYGLEEKRGN